MNRQQRRDLERKAKKDQKKFRNTLNNPKERKRNEPVIRQTWMESAIYNNHEWSVRLERIRDIKGIGPVLMDKIFKSLEGELTVEERTKARKIYESGDGVHDFRDPEAN